MLFDLTSHYPVHVPFLSLPCLNFCKGLLGGGSRHGYLLEAMLPLPRPRGCVRLSPISHHHEMAVHWHADLKAIRPWPPPFTGKLPDKSLLEEIHWPPTDRIVPTWGRVASQVLPQSFPQVLAEQKIRLPKGCLVRGKNHLQRLR